uniref:Uncharacterized protein n=1 Tax=Melopsittacus undulatus TaxID=13146 RepID=A0A8V5HAX2_MELUD
MKPVGEEPVLLAELKPGRPQRYDWKSSCETWSVAFSPDGAWFAWSQGHCVVKLIPWPLREPELLLRIWALELRSPVAFAPMTNGLCCMYFPHGGFIATGYVCVRGEQRHTWLLTTFPVSLGLQAGFLGWGMPVPAASSGHMGIIESSCVLFALCSHLWVLLQHQGWPRPVLDRSKGPLVIEALVPQGSAHLPHNLPGPGAPHSQEAEGIPHLPDLLKQGAMWMQEVRALCLVAGLGQDWRRPRTTTSR